MYASAAMVNMYWRLVVSLVDYIHSFEVQGEPIQ